MSRYQLIGRRTSEWPKFMANGQQLQTGTRWKAHSLPGGRLILKCGSSGRTQVGDWLYPGPIEEQPAVFRQSRFGWLEANGYKVGAIEATRYNATFDIQNDEFLQIMDIDRDSESELAQKVCEAWDNIGTYITDFGSIIEISNVWMDPKFPLPISLARLVRLTLAPWLKTHALIVTKAFPLEYTGLASRSEAQERAFQRRFAALLRLYEGQGLTRFPGALGEDGWMYQLADRLL